MINTLKPTRNSEVLKNERRKPIRWDQDERQLLADYTADRLIDEPSKGMLHCLQEVVAEYLPPDKQRVINTLQAVPGLPEMITEAFHMKQSHPVIIEVPQPLPPIETILARLDFPEIGKLFFAKLSEMSDTMHNMQERLDHLEKNPTGDVRVSVSVNHSSNTPKLVTQVKVWHIGLDGFSSNQISEIERRTANHKQSLKFIPRAILGSASKHREHNKPFPSIVEAIIVFKKRIDRRHLDKQLEGLPADKIQIGWASNLDDVVRMAINVVMRSPIDYQP